MCLKLTDLQTWKPRVRTPRTLEGLLALGHADAESHVAQQHKPPRFRYLFRLKFLPMDPSISFQFFASHGLQTFSKLRRSDLIVRWEFVAWPLASVWICITMAVASNSSSQKREIFLSLHELQDFENWAVFGRSNCLATSWYCSNTVVLPKWTGQLTHIIADMFDQKISDHLHFSILTGHLDALSIVVLVSRCGTWYLARMVCGTGGWIRNAQSCTKPEGMKNTCSGNGFSTPPEIRLYKSCKHWGSPISFLSDTPFL